MATFEITKVNPEIRTWTAKKGPAAGQEFHSYSVTAKGPDGELHDFEVSRKPSSPPPPLGVVEAEVQPSNGNFPDKLKLTPQGRSNGFSGGSQGKDDYWNKREQRDIESQARQGRAHAQEMAIRWLSFLCRNETREVGEDELRRYADWFHADVQRFPVDADVGGGGESKGGQSPVAPVDGSAVSAKPTRAATDVSAPGNGFVSEKQRAYYDRLLNNSEWSQGERATVTRYLQQTNSATVSAAIDALKDGSEAERFGLLHEAANWAAKQSDVPLDESQ